MYFWAPGFPILLIWYLKVSGPNTCGKECLAYNVKCIPGLSHIALARAAIPLVPSFCWEELYTGEVANMVSSDLESSMSFRLFLIIK